MYNFLTNMNSLQALCHMTTPVYFHLMSPFCVSYVLFNYLSYFDRWLNSFFQQRCQ